jgi:hypothetical protein
MVMPYLITCTSYVVRYPAAQIGGLCLQKCMSECIFESLLSLLGVLGLIVLCSVLFDGVIDFKTSQDICCLIFSTYFIYE